MRLILTHEQADFDALASLLAAWLLDDSALALLPRRMNRNVRAYMTLYGTELPFVDVRDLSPESVESITLVDTQSMITLKGVNDQTPVYVVDHHVARLDLPDHWHLTFSEVGATVTMIIEALQEHEAHLSMVHATLLLIGIYEDTGSLTYSRTTSRDLQAAAYLLSQGANLSIAVEFLNHPLSLQQQAIYDAARASAKVHIVHGHSVVIACGDARQTDEELSTIAHKLRDHFDPDALFLLLQTRSGLQLIARSNTDHIDVGKIAAYFGGGGHDRASAALIRERSLEEVCTELRQQLQDWVRPAVTVAQIMSRRPQLLNPDSPVQEAALRMQRFGYEGYPIVENGKVVGLLTRRAVDRAISHKLNLTAVSLMEAGSITVTPEDSIEHLQQIMTDSGWGQIPVVHPENDEIIGIVTRTDLLKTFSQNIPAAMPDLSGRLSKALPYERLELLRQVAEAAHQQHTAIYIVGGFVRDLLLERPSLDFDIVVEGDAIALARAFAERLGGRVTAHSRFGTAKWLPNGSHAGEWTAGLDFISARTEFYTHPTALPTIERSSIKLDLHRRDFTINTLAIRLDGRHFGELHDYWGGANDLERGLVRVLHSLSFVDDPTRMLRAVRFEQRFGFQIEARTLDLLQEALPLIDRVSGERIRHELDRSFGEENAIQVLVRLKDLKLLQAIDQALIWDNWLETRFDLLLDPQFEPDWDISRNWRGVPVQRVLAYILWLIRLSPTDLERIIDRLSFSRDVKDAIHSAAQLWESLGSLAAQSPSQIVNRLDGIPKISIFAVYLACDSDGIRELLQEYINNWSQIHAHTAGDDLRALGLPPGPHYRQILTELRRAWLDGEISSIDEEHDLLDKLLHES